jgi:hypothetical protein
VLERHRSLAAIEGGNIKGAAFLEFVRWFEAEYGLERLSAAVVSLPEPTRRALELDPASPRILSSRWYEAAAIHALLEALTGSAEPAERARMAEQGAAAIMRGTLRGLYRVLFDWLATPARYARFADRLWRAYYDAGEFTVEQIGETRAVATIRAWPSHHPFLCEMHRHAAAEIYREMGCEDVQVRREACVAAGTDTCRFVTTWRAASSG